MIRSRYDSGPSQFGAAWNDSEELKVLLGFDAAELRGEDKGLKPGAPRPSAADLADAARRIMASREHPPATGDTEALVAHLVSRLEGAGIDQPPDPAWQESAADTLAPFGLLQILAPQIQFLRLPFWLATAVVLLGGMLAIAWFGGGAPSSALFLMMGAPLLTALGIASAFQSRSRPMGELEATFPITPEQVVWGRTVLVVGYDTALALVGSLLLSVLAPGELPLGPLIVSWLAPMLGLAAIALAASTGSAPWLGTAASLGLWSLIVLAHRQGWTTWFQGVIGGPDAAEQLLLLSRMAVTAAGALALIASVRRAMIGSRRRWLREAGGT